MARTDPPTNGEGPEDSDPGPERPHGEGGPPLEDDEPEVRDGPPLEDDEPEVRGWVPPELRPWRHPSEVPGASRPPGGVLVAPRPVTRSREAWVSALVGAGAAALVVMGGLFMASPRPTGANGSRPTSTTKTNATSGSVGRTGASLVALLTAGAAGTKVDCAVAVASGGLVATTADALAGATSVKALRDGRWVDAAVVGTDANSDVALVRVPFDLPVARFTDGSAVVPGSRVWTMDVTWSSPGSNETAQWSTSEGTVSTADAAVNGPRGTGMPSIVVASPLGVDTTGGVLVKKDGTVLGIQDTSVWPGMTGEVFIPADLVVGVSEDLAADGSVSHGWLGMNGGDSPASGGSASSAPRGAAIETVDPSGPAAGVLQPGDVIVAIDGTAVHSMAELRSQLYMLQAGSPVQLRVYRNGALTTVEVDLGSSP